MRIYFVLAFATMPILLSCCAAHPLPGDYTNGRVDTFSIILNARCEATDVVRERLDAKLKQSGSPEIVRMSPEEVPDNLEFIRSINPAIARNLEKFRNSQIVYDFDFNITETNDNSGSLAFTWPIAPNTKATMGAGASQKTVRQAVRKVKISESFEDLRKLDCANAEYYRGNPVYPIYGSIGMGEVMNTFIDLSQNGGGNGSFTDTLTFTTDIGNSLTPHLTLEVVPGKINLATAQLTAKNSRMDIHKLTVTITFPTDDDRSIVTQTARLSSSEIRNTVARAEFEACVARAEDREDRFGQLRDIPPEVLCADRVSGRGFYTGYRANYAPRLLPLDGPAENQ
ncbi:MAG: hypothetical protein WBO55_15640 [Rhizobiaceae bacterium]